METRTVMLAVGAGVAAIFVGGLMLMLFKPSHKALGPEVLVASRRLLIGEKIAPERVHWQEWPEASVFKGTVKRMHGQELKDLDILGTPLRRNLESGEPITSQALVGSKDANNLLAAALDPGMRAIGVSVKANTSAGGFIQPGDRVDVILSYRVQIPKELKEEAEDLVERYASQTILNNIRVLAVDLNNKEETVSAKVGKTVTLEVTKAGAETLALAQSMGYLTLALRHMGEQDAADAAPPPLTTDIGLSDILSKLKDTSASANTSAKTKTDASARTIRVYNGNDIQNVPVRSGKE